MGSMFTGSRLLDWPSTSITSETHRNWQGRYVNMKMHASSSIVSRLQIQNAVITLHRNVGNRETRANLRKTRVMWNGLEN